LDWTVRQAAQRSATGKVTLIGHSTGGVLGRLYLSPEPFLGRTYRGLERVDRLITLGSPHYNTGGLARGGCLSRWVEQRYPGAYYAPEVAYVSVAGRLRRGDLGGSRAERWAYQTYRDLCGDGAVWGDGLIPVASALLQGARPVTLEGVSHFPGFGQHWYGDAEIVRQWWSWTESHPGVGAPGSR
jgi:pimeloyl-ACP methyl ester carboxylesterase